MDNDSRRGVWGLVLIGAGVGLAMAGAAMVTPVCAAWSRDKLQDAYEKRKKTIVSGLGTAAETLGDLAAKMQQPLAGAAQAAKQTTAIAAGAIESAARHVRERVQ